MDTEHKKKFLAVIEKYNLADKAEEIANYILKTEKVSAEEFAKLFAIEVDDAHVLISFIEEGIKFKEKHLDK